jgi:branched-chain amino acid aminotransferase
VLFFARWMHPKGHGISAAHTCHTPIAPRGGGVSSIFSFHGHGHAQIAVRAVFCVKMFFTSTENGMIHRFVFHNDRVLPIEQVRLSPGQSGLLSGWGLFTTIRVVEGIPFGYERHWERLERDAERTHCPFPFKEEIVRAQMAGVLRANEVREGCARIYAIYNQVGFWRSNEKLPEADLLICSADLPSYREPVRLFLREHGRHAASPLAGVKVTSWLNNVWNLREAEQAGFDEVVLLNERGEVAECTAANIFCVHRGRVTTPPLAAGCLQGITRGILLDEPRHAWGQRDQRPQDRSRAGAGDPKARKSLRCVRSRICRSASRRLGAPLN